MAEWQSIETAPRDGTLYWLVEAGVPLGLTIEHQFVGYWTKDKRYQAGGCWRNADRDFIAEPYAWMPLPDPPVR